MKKVIYDCDNTMGISNRDIDDGLALLYLINNPEVELLGVTCTYGNDNIDYVYNQTIELMKEINCDIPVYKGRGGYKMKDYYAGVYINETSKNIEDVKKNEAAQFIVSMVHKYPEELSIIATGSMQNLYDASIIDQSIIANIKEIVLMGGITKPLKVGNKIMNELNFSVCPEGAFTVLNKATKLSVLTGNNCMDVEFTGDEFRALKKRFEEEGHKLKNEFVIRKIEKWMNEFKDEYGCDSIVPWDVIAAIYLTNPELFDDRFVTIRSKLDDFSIGYINTIRDYTENVTLSREDVFKIVDRYKDVELNIGRNVINLPTVKSSEEVNKKMIEIVHG